MSWTYFNRWGPFIKRYIFNLRYWLNLFLYFFVVNFIWFMSLRFIALSNFSGWISWSYLWSSVILLLCLSKYIRLIKLSKVLWFVQLFPCLDSRAKKLFIANYWISESIFRLVSLNYAYSPKFIINNIFCELEEKPQIYTKI